MNFKEKKLYHQIHPLKLLIDWATDAVALYFLWTHRWLVAIIVMFIHAIIVSIIIIKFVNLKKFKESSFVKSHE